MKYVIANWKQNKCYEDVEPWCSQLWESIKDLDFTKVTPVICPPATFLEKMSTSLPTLALGMQDLSPFKDGAHTGFIGIHQARHYCKYAIIGHSERGEERELVYQKARISVESGVVPIVCFKSPSEYRPIEGAICALEDPDNISVDGQYHPKSISEINKLLKNAGSIFGDSAKIIYGGSANVENALELSSLNGLSGILVGNASLNPKEFAQIIRIFSK